MNKQTDVVKKQQVLSSMPVDCEPQGSEERKIQKLGKDGLSILREMAMAAGDGTEPPAPPDQGSWDLPVLSSSSLP